MADGSGRGGSSGDASNASVALWLHRDNEEGWGLSPRGADAPADTRRIEYRAASLDASRPAAVAYAPPGLLPR